MAPSLDVSLGTNSQDTAAASITLTTSAAAASGSRILLAVHHRDTVGDVLAAGVSGGSLQWDLVTNSPVNGTMRLAWFTAYAPAGLASSTVLTTTFTTLVSGNKGVMAASFLGTDPRAWTYPLDTTAFSTAAGAAAWTCDIVTSLADELVFGVTAIDTSTSPTNAPTVGTEVHEFFGAGNRAYATQYAVPSSPTTQTISGTWSGLTGASTKVTSLVAIRSPYPVAGAWLAA